MECGIRPMLGGTSEEPTEGTAVTLTPIAKAEATLREALVAYQKWYDEFEGNDTAETTAEQVVDQYLRWLNVRLG